jgi:hypothetical protein
MPPNPPCSQRGPPLRALAIDALAPAKRAHVALAMLGDPGATAFWSPRAAAVATALAAHPAWTDADRALHEWIARQAQVERGDRGDGANNAASARNGDAWATLEPVFEHVIAEDASSSSPDVRARARATVAQWIEQVRAAQGVRFTSVSSARDPGRAPLRRRGARATREHELEGNRVARPQQAPRGLVDPGASEARRVARVEAAGGALLKDLAGRGLEQELLAFVGRRAHALDQERRTSDTLRNRLEWTSSLSAR